MRVVIPTTYVREKMLSSITRSKYSIVGNSYQSIKPNFGVQILFLPIYLSLHFRTKKTIFFSWKIRLGISIMNRNFEVHIVAFWAFKNKYFYQYIWGWILEVKGMFSWKINLLRIIINRNFGFHILAFWDFKNKYFYQYVWT